MENKEKSLEQKINELENRIFLYRMSEHLEFNDFEAIRRMEDELKELKNLEEKEKEVCKI